MTQAGSCWRDGGRRFTITPGIDGHLPGGSAMRRDDEDDELAQRWYDRKSSLMEASLGKEHDMVMHAIIPYAVGGGLDLYYYPNGLPGTAIATKELSEVPNQGSANNVYRS